MKKVSKGRSMIEMLGVLAIIGVLSVGGLIAYSYAMHKSKINKMLASMDLTAVSILTKFNSFTIPDGGFEITTLKDQLELDPVNPFDSENTVEIKLYKSDSYFNEPGISFTYPSITKRTCLSIIQTLDGTTPYVAVSVSDTIIADSVNGSLKSLKTACGQLPETTAYLSPVIKTAYAATGGALVFFYPSSKEGAKNADWSKDDSTCGKGFYHNGTGCVSCPSGGSCDGDDMSCKKGYYQIGKTCVPCDSTCESCTGPNANECKTCAPSHYQKAGLCVPCPANHDTCTTSGFTCKDYFYKHTNLGQCLACDPSCKTCVGAAASNCTSCNDNYFYEAGYNCLPCPEHAATCTASGFTCKQGYIKRDRTCMACEANCLRCTAPAPFEGYCMECAEGYVRDSGRCVRQ